MEKQLLISSIPMLTVMCQPNKSGKIEAHTLISFTTCWEAECESQISGLALCQWRSNHFATLSSTSFWTEAGLIL